MIKKQEGFTLVEIAIVMVIIGLLIGGILKGQELVNNSRVTRTISDVQSVHANVVIFKDRFNSLPGDAPANKIIGCNASNNCLGGDGNGSIAGVLGQDHYAWTSRIPTSGIGQESYQVWKHLSLTNMITGINIGADPSSEAGWGVTHLAAPVGGGFEFYYDGWMASGAGGPGSAGHIMRLSSNGLNGSSGVGGVISPSDAARIDRKLDDGNPNIGYVFADYGVRAGSVSPCKDADSTYREGNASAACLLFFRVIR